MNRKLLTCLVLSLSQITFFIILTLIYKGAVHIEIGGPPKRDVPLRRDNIIPNDMGINQAGKTTAQLDNLKDASVTTDSPHTTQRPRLKLIVAIMSAPRRVDRREGIRRTWMTDCSRLDVVCRFFTERFSDLEPELKAALTQERARHSDLEFMPIPRGYNFGTRMLWLIEWATRSYEFDFFLRIDDDYFLCLKRLLAEIPYRVHIPRLYWGHFHCVVEGQVRVDEGFLMLSADLAKELASERDQLLCHPFGDQTVAIWLNNRTDITRFHDPRVIHAVTARSPELREVRNLCSTYLGLHGSYLHENLLYWEMAKAEAHAQPWVPSIQPFEQVCKLGTYFDWRKMGGAPYTWEPKPCAMSPVWEINRQKMHIGRGMM